MPLNRPVTTQQLAAYTCPSDTPTATPSRYSGVTHHNYLANFGNTGRYQEATLGTKSNGTTPNAFAGAPFRNVSNNNTKPQNYGIRDIFDGTSNTLLFSEGVQGRDGDLRGFAWWTGGTYFTTYLTPNSTAPDRTESASYCKPANPLNPPCSGTISPTQYIATRSRHPGGVQSAMGDGACRFFSDNVNLDVWRALGSTGGKESVSF